LKAEVEDIRNKVASSFMHVGFYFKIKEAFNICRQKLSPFYRYLTGSNEIHSGRMN